MTIDKLRALLRIESDITDLLEELREMIAAGLIEIQRDDPEVQAQESLPKSLTAAE